MIFHGLAFLAGVLALHACFPLPDVGQVAVLSVVALACLRPHRLRPLATALGGFVWAWWQVSQLLAVQLPAPLAGRDLLVQGVVRGLPESSAGAARFRFHVMRYRTSEDSEWLSLPLPVQLRWYRRAPVLAPGDLWQLKLRLKPPHGFANPGGFDYERWLLVQRIRATGYVRSHPGNRRRATEACCVIDRWRGRLAQFVDRRLEGTAAGLVRALSIGDRGGLDPHAWDVMRITGTAHLMAISGLHIGLVAGFAFVLTRRLWGMSGLSNRWPAPAAAALAAVAAAAVYALMAGFALPAQRALIMVAVFMSALLVRRSVSPWRSLTLALWLVLLRDPLAALSPGFWLSFGAVGWILYGVAGRHGVSGRMAAAVRVQLALSVGLLPVMLIGFQQWPLLAPLANLFAVPWTGLLAVPMILVAALLYPFSPGLSGGLFEAAGWVLALLWRCLEWLAAWPDTLWVQALPAAWVALPLAAGLLLWLAPAGMPARLSAAFLVVPLMLVKPEQPQSGAVWLALLDVGQGLSAVVRTRRHVLVYDAGPRFPSGFDTGSAVVTPYLTEMGIGRIDRLLISHADNDHIGGARALFERFDVRSVLSGTPDAIDWARAQPCRRGQSWVWDGVRFDILSPSHGRGGNNGSCVLRVTSAAGQRVLLPGDIESPVEQTLVEQEGQRLRSEVLVAPHHGSRTSSTRPFVAAVQPRYVLFAAGYANRFGFPKTDVAARYRALGATAFVTGREGAVTVRLAARGGIRVSAWRREQRRHWRRPAPR